MPETLAILAITSSNHELWNC